MPTYWDDFDQIMKMLRKAEVATIDNLAVLRDLRDFEKMDLHTMCIAIPETLEALSASDVPRQDWAVQFPKVLTQQRLAKEQRVRNLAGPVPAEQHPQIAAQSSQQPAEQHPQIAAQPSQPSANNDNALQQYGFWRSMNPSSQACRGSEPSFF